MRKGSKMSPESRRKMSLRKLGQPSPKRGSKLTEEQKSKISLKLKGILHNEARKLANREAQIRRYKKIDPNYELKGRNKRIADNGGSHSKGEWETLKAQYNWTCPSCKRSEPSITLTKDHIVSLLRGGSDNIENIQPLCKSCNCKKHAQTIKY